VSRHPPAGFELTVESRTAPPPNVTRTKLTSMAGCHGMVDTNVFFQDTVRLVQRLIELRKENWQVAMFPVENHGFEEGTSWADEYKRILKLFDDNVKGRTH
jgi:Prolyl oligopeptidase family